MASELSQFIEKELQAQGIEDDEEQKLLSDLKVKPLSVDASAPLERSTWSSRKNILFLVGGIVLVALIIVGAGSYYKSGLTTRDIAQPDKTMPPLDPPKSDVQEEEEDYDEYKDETVLKREEEKKEEEKKHATEKKTQKDSSKEDSADYEDYDYSPDVKTPVKDEDAKKKKNDKNRRRYHRKLASYTLIGFL